MVMRKVLRTLFYLLACVVMCGSDNCGGGGCLCDNPTQPERENDAKPLTYVHPADHSTGQSQTPFLLWNKHPDPKVTSYQAIIEIDIGQTLYFSEEITDTFVTFADTLLEATEYNWYVLAFKLSQNAYIQGPNWYFTTGTGFNNTPVPPFNPIPKQAATGVFISAELIWDCYDPDGDDLTYDVWLREFPADAVLIADDITEKIFDPADFNPGQRYDWKVVAQDEHGASTEGEWWIFDTLQGSNKPPIAPHAPYPPDDITHVPLDVTLTWQCRDPEDDPIYYDVEMGPAGEFLVEVATDLRRAEFDVTSLDPDKEYEWRVTATDRRNDPTVGPIWSFTTGDGSQPDVFAVFTLARSITYDGSVVRNDFISARFDSLYAPDGPINPKQPASVSCREFDLVWQPSSSQFFYNDYVNGYFLDPAGTYLFTVGEGDGVPPITTDPISLPGCAPYITSPAPFADVPRTGFDLLWHTQSCGRIDITMIDLNSGDSTGVYVRTDDDGFHTFSEADLSVIPPSVYQIQIVLVKQVRETINVPGYDPRSWVWARTLSSQIVMMPPVGE
jgi:hypothetical protein